MSTRRDIAKRRGPQASSFLCHVLDHLEQFFQAAFGGLFGELGIAPIHHDGETFAGDDDLVLLGFDGGDAFLAGDQDAEEELQEENPQNEPERSAQKKGSRKSTFGAPVLDEINLEISPKAHRHDI